MPDEHAKLSPSDAKRWLYSPASLRAERIGLKKYPWLYRDGSVYAEEGTVAHSLAEAYLKAYFEGPDMDDIESIKQIESDKYYNPGMAEAVNDYVEQVIEIYNSYEKRGYKNEIYFEKRVHMDRVSPHCWGTSDVVIANEKYIHIIDLKYGMGVPVSAENNPQLKLYAYGAYETLGAHRWENNRNAMAHFTIIQPRLNSTSTGSIWCADLVRFADWCAEVLAKEPFFNPSSDTLRWDAMKHVLRPYADFYLKMVPGINRKRLVKGRMKLKKFPELTNEELAGIVAHASEIKRYIDGVVEFARQKADKGAELPGLKMIEGKAFRSFKGRESEIEEMLDMLEYDPELIYKPREIRSLTDLEATLGKREFNELVAPYIKTNRGLPRLVGENEPGKRYDKKQNAKDEFDDYTE